MPLSSVVGAQSIVKPGVCTSSTRPASPFVGQVIYETDTDEIVIWDGSSWTYKTGANFDSTGRMTNPVQPVFHAGRSAGDVAGGTAIAFNDATINRGNHYNSTNGRFTAPIAGLYFFYAKVMYNGLNPSGAMIQVDGSGTYSQDYQDGRSTYAGWQNSHMRITLSLNANQYVTVFNSGSNTCYGTASHHTYFGGYLVA